MPRGRSGPLSQRAMAPQSLADWCDKRGKTAPPCRIFLCAYVAGCVSTAPPAAHCPQTSPPPTTSTLIAGMGFSTLPDRVQTCMPQCRFNGGMCVLISRTRSVVLSPVGLGAAKAEMLVK